MYEIKKKIKKNKNLVTQIILLSLLFTVLSSIWLIEGKWIFLNNLTEHIPTQILLITLLKHKTNIIMDQLSLSILILNVIIGTICITHIRNTQIISYIIKESMTKVILLLTITTTYLLITNDIFLLYALIEITIIPFIFLFGINNKKSEKLMAFLLLTIFTIFGSLAFLISILTIQLKTGTTDISILNTITIDNNTQKIIFIFFFISFITKFPSIPLYTWLPEAHVESTTEGSILLAAIILKIPTYCYIRIVTTTLLQASTYFYSIIYLIAISSIILSSVIAIKETNIKRIFAYSSISHMNLCLLSISFITNTSINAVIIYMFMHGITATLLFYHAGHITTQSKTKNSFYYTGLTNIIPIFSITIIISALSNISFPLTGNFIAEILITISIIENSRINALIYIFFGMCIITIYIFWLITKIIYGITNTKTIKKIKDFDKKEVKIVTSLIIITIICGIKPQMMVTTI